VRCWNCEVGTILESFNLITWNYAFWKYSTFNGISFGECKIAVPLSLYITFNWMIVTNEFQAVACGIYLEQR
jgi:hypothetical protein